MKTILLSALCIVCASNLLFAVAEEPKPLPAISVKTAGMKKHPGFLPFYWDERTGKIWLEIERWDTEFLYYDSLPGGVGSNDIGLDRAELGDTRIVRFYRSGPRVLLIRSNYSFRASSTNASERQSVNESFAESALWGFETGAAEGDRVLIDATAFLLSDIHNVAGVLKEAKQGEYKLEDSRSAFYWPRTKNFPQNTEIEALLTFTGTPAGDFVKEVVPAPNSITVREHHSFVQLPDTRYVPRRFDPRAGFYSTGYLDFSTPIGEPLTKMLLARHRLKKKNPGAAVSEPERQIVYYMDPGAPEPVRSALMEGAKWWNTAFENAGFKNAFDVKLLPNDIDPMDIRYNVIQWVHRITRGWSYGTTVVDPRTGEILKGLVRLGSQRVRQDYLIAEGLLAPYETGKPVRPEMEKMALARLRQLAAHEVGHTLGLVHNYGGSISNRASVMDYPHPLVRINSDGTLDLNDAYSTGVGEWDKTAIAYGYTEFANEQDEKQGLKSILDQAISRGLVFITDFDARAEGGAHPQAHLWDNGTDAVAELSHVLDVRKAALSRFSEKNIREGIPFSNLEEVLVPVYLFHRYQTIAVSKVLGGVDYRYALRGDGQLITEMVAPKNQREALETLLRTVQPQELAFPEAILKLIPPRAFGYPRWRETFATRSGVTFDALAGAEGAANLTIGLMLNPERATRLIQQHAIVPDAPDLAEVIEKLLTATWKTSQKNDGYHAEIQRVVDEVGLYHLMALATADKTTEQAQAVAFLKLMELKQWLTAQLKSSLDEGQKAHFTYALHQIRQFEENPKQIVLPKPLDPPPGAPIGCW